MNQSTDSNETDSDCALATFTANLPYYRVILIAECVFAGLAIVPNAMLIVIISRVGVFPANLRLLLGHFSLMLLWYSAGNSIKSVYLLVATSCAYNISVFWCKIMDLACTAVALPIMFYTLTALCAERLYATIRYNIYDKTASRKPWFAGLLIVMSWACAIGIHGNTVLSLPVNEFVPICESNFIPLKSSTVYEVYMALELAAGLITAFVHWYNRFIARNMAINRALYDLSSRFQVDQNGHVNVVLVPSVILHIICHIPTFLLVIVVRGEFETSQEMRAYLTRLTYLWRLLYALAHPLIAFRFNKYLKQQLYQSLVGQLFTRVRHHGKPNSIQDRGAVIAAQEKFHWGYLHNQWDRAHDQKTNTNNKPNIRKQTSKF